MNYKKIAWTIFVIAAFIKGYISFQRNKEKAQESVPEPKSESVAVAEEDLSWRNLESTPEYITPISYKKIGDRWWTANNIGITVVENMRPCLDNNNDENNHDTLGYQTNDGAIFSWLDAIRVCPQGFRLPRKDEFLKLSIKELGKGSWWTSNVTRMTIEENDDYETSEENNEPRKTILATRMYIGETDTSIQFDEENIYDKNSSVRCIKDSSEIFMGTVNNTPDIITTKSGIISSAKFEPFYEYPHDEALCVGDRGDGGRLTVLFSTGKKYDKINIDEFGYNNLCLPPDVVTERKEDSYHYEIPDPKTCINSSLDNMYFLPLFQQGAWLDIKTCSRTIYRKWTWSCTEDFIINESCGDTISVSFTGIIKKVSRIPRNIELPSIYPLNIRDSSLCTYKIFIPHNGNTITTTHKCEDVKIGDMYNITGTITYSEIDKDDTAAMSFVFGKCPARAEPGGKEYSSLKFKHIATLDSLRGFDIGNGNSGTIYFDRKKFTWLDAINVCPNGYRIPRKEEIQKYHIHNLGNGIWWTSNATKMYNTEQHFEDLDYTEIKGRVFAATININKNNQDIETSEANFNEEHSVLCIEDSSENYTKTVSDIPDKTTFKTGTITRVSFWPHYQGPEGSDCYCGEGNGGILDIHLDSEKDSNDIVEVYDYGGYDICIPSESEDSESEESVLTEPNEQKTCQAPEVNIFNMLPLFQKGAKVKSKQCKFDVFVDSQIGLQYVRPYSCGDTITVSFTGVIKDLSPVFRHDYLFMFPIDLQDNILCSYKIFNPENGNTITTIHKCKDVLIGSTYKITGTITYIDDPTHEKRIAVMHTFYPCCHGRGDALGDTYTSLDFEQIDTSN